MFTSWLAVWRVVEFCERRHESVLVVLAQPAAEAKAEYFCVGIGLL